MVHEQAVTALEALAGALPAADYATALTTGPRRTPRLTAVSRDDPCVDVDVYAEAGWYWWPWGERIAKVTDPPTAAVAVARLLRPLPALVAVHG